MKKFEEIVDGDAYIIEYKYPPSIAGAANEQWYRVVALSTTGYDYVQFCELGIDFPNIETDYPTRVLAKIDLANLSVHVYDVPIGNAAYEDFYLNSLTDQEYFWLNTIKLDVISYTRYYNMKVADAQAIKTLFDRGYATIDPITGVSITPNGDQFIKYREQVIDRQLKEKENGKD